MATDLEFGKWSMIYSCQHRGEEKYRWETVSLYTRDPQVDDETRDFVKALMVGLGFRIGDHRVISQENCL